MKICFVHPHGYNAFKGRSIGGTQLQLYNISTMLAKEEDFDVFFITRGINSQREIEGVKLVPGIGKVDTISEKFMTALKMFYALNKVDADLYFSSSSHVDPGFIGIFCKLKNRKHVHRTVHERQLDGSLVRKHPFKGLMNQLGLKLADKVFTQSREHAQMALDRYGIDSEVLPNSFSLRDKETLGGNYILWVGRRISWKRPDLILDLAEEFPNEDFVLIAPRTSGSQEYYDRIESRARKLSNVDLKARVPRDKIQEYFDNAKIFVNTSEKEGFPNTFVEAGKGYTPILSFKVNPDNFIDDENCGFCADGSYTDLKQKMGEMVRKEGQTSQQGRNCRRYVEKTHDISKNIEKVRKAIQGLRRTE